VVPASTPTLTRLSACRRGGYVRNWTATTTPKVRTTHCASIVQGWLHPRVRERQAAGRFPCQGPTLEARLTSYRASSSGLGCARIYGSYLVPGCSGNFEPAPGVMRVSLGAPAVFTISSFAISPDGQVPRARETASCGWTTPATREPRSDESHVLATSPFYQHAVATLECP